MSDPHNHPLDPPLRHALAAPPACAEDARGRDAALPPDTRLTVLIAWSASAEALTALGVAVSSLADGIASGTMQVAALPALAADPRALSVETASLPQHALDLSGGADEVEAARRPPGLTGRGVIVGIVDTGVDLWHPAFRRTDGSSAVLQLWDQNLTAANGEAPPAGFGYGVEYGADLLRLALRSQPAASGVRHRDRSGHGTRMASIAAGGTAPDRGIAPDADLIVVATASSPGALGNAARTLDAARYIFAAAAALGRPCVINLGGDLSQCDSRSLLARGLDALLCEPGRALVTAGVGARKLVAHAAHSAAQSVDGALHTAPIRRAPRMTGAIALLLQAEPHLDAAAIERRLAVSGEPKVRADGNEGDPLPAAGSARSQRRLRRSTHRRLLAVRAHGADTAALYG